MISIPAETCNGQNGQEQGWKDQQERIFAAESQKHMKYQRRLSKKIFLQDFVIFCRKGDENSKCIDDLMFITQFIEEKTLTYYYVN